MTCALIGTDAVAQTLSPRLLEAMLGALEEAQESPESALRELAELAGSRWTGNKDRGLINRERAAILLQLERSAEARTLLENTLEGQTDDYVPSVRLLYAQLLLMEGDGPAALRELEIWEQSVRYPRTEDTALLGYAYLQVERFDDAVRIFERTLAEAEAAHSDDRDRWVELLVYAYSRSGREAQALALLDTTIQRQPLDAKWWRQLGMVYLLLEDYPPGAAGLAIASQLTRLSFTESRRLARLLSGLGMPADAAVFFQAAIERETQSVDYEDRMLLAELYVLARDIEEAIGVLNAVAADAKDGEPGLLIGRLHLRWERYAEAQNALEQAVDAYGESVPDELWYLLAITSINLEDSSRAQQALANIDASGAYAARAERLWGYVTTDPQN